MSGCSEALGMKSGKIKDYQITASSSYADAQPSKARESKYLPTNKTIMTNVMLATPYFRACLHGGRVPQLTGLPGYEG